MSEKNVENKTKSDSNLAPIFVDHHVLPDIKFNGHCLINKIYVPKKGKKICIFLTYCLHG